jgi:hypothetical protein
VASILSLAVCVIGTIVNVANVNWQKFVKLKIKNKNMNNVERENVSKVLNDLNVLRNFNYLYDRWQDEKGYEDFNEYANAMMKKMPDGAKLIKGTKRPFGVKFNYGGDILQVYIKFEDHGKYCKLVAKIING